jgi:hypothetical protein
MPASASSEPAALGFRVKSGWAAAVLVAGPGRSPRILDSRAIDLCDPAVPGSRQPYHARMGTLQTDEAKVKQLRQVISRAAERSVAKLIQDYRAAGQRVRAAALVVGSDKDPAKITNPHIRAHALEGRLFRTVLEEALKAGGLPSSVIVEKGAYARAAEVLVRSEDNLKGAVTDLGRGLGKPWRADEKVAALAAWMMLA